MYRVYFVKRRVLNYSKDVSCPLKVVGFGLACKKRKRERVLLMIQMGIFYSKCVEKVMRFCVGRFCGRSVFNQLLNCM